MSRCVTKVDATPSGSSPDTGKDVVLLQTSDARSRYLDMLNITSETVRAYCALHDFHHWVFVGLKRGILAWHATYNRIDLLSELVDSDYRGWVLYMDADAWIADLSVDLRGYLKDLGRYSIVGTPAFALSDSYWNMNIGVLLLNLAHPFTPELIRQWKELLSRHDLAEEAIEWGVEIPDDQAMFHEVLRQNHQARSCILHVDKAFMNSPQAKFARQAIRAEHADFDQRLRHVAEEAGKALCSHGDKPGESVCGANTNAPGQRVQNG